MRWSANMLGNVIAIAVFAGLTLSTSAHAIIGGERATSGQFPASVSLVKNGQHICSGMRMGDQQITTARHCLEQLGPLPAEIEVRWGESAQHHDRISLKVSTQGATAREDWAVLETQGNARLPDELAIQDKFAAFDGTRPLMITGYGCADMYGHAGGDYLRVARARTPYQVQDKIHFTSTPDSGHFPALCPGDSGASAYQQNAEGVWVVVGVNSSIGLVQGDLSSGSSKIQALPASMHTSSAACQGASAWEYLEKPSAFVGGLLPSLQSLL